MIKVEEFIARRSKLIEKMDDDSIALIFAGIPKVSSADESFPFIVNRNFLYLTNIYQEGSILVIKKSGGLVNDTLYIHEYNEIYEKWIGKRLTIEEAKAISAVNNILYLNQVESDLSIILKNSSIKKIYLDLDEEIKIKEHLTTLELKDIFKKVYPTIEIENIYDEIVSLRMVKSEAEIEEFKKAIYKTDLGLKAIIKKIKPGLKEYQLKSLFYYTIQDFDNSELSFPTIVSSGINATCLHYEEAKDEIKNNDLVLFDLGSRNNTYCADISRTYPANGKFTPLQKTIYEIVLNCNKMVIENAKEGVTIKELNNMVIEFLATNCLKAGLINNKEEIEKYYFHSISHHIGLDTHDPVSSNDKSLKRAEIPLKEGNIISDEPGLYFKELGIGVRIEDDLLITKDGCINLSKDIIKEVEDIEKAFERR